MMTAQERSILMWNTYQVINTYQKHRGDSAVDVTPRWVPGPLGFPGSGAMPRCNAKVRHQVKAQKRSRRAHYYVSICMCKRAGWGKIVSVVAKGGPCAQSSVLRGPREMEALTLTATMYVHTCNLNSMNSTWPEARRWFDSENRSSLEPCAPPYSGNSPYYYGSVSLRSARYARNS